MTISIGFKKQSAMVVATSNTSVLLTDLQANSSDTVVAFTVGRIYWSTANTTTGIKLARGANTLVILQGSDHWDLDVSELALTQDSTANLVITIPDGASTCVLELKKVLG